MKEDAIQKAIVTLLGTRVRRDIIWHSIPNEAKRSKVEGARLKALGMLPGVADMLFVIGGRAHYLEFKTPIGRQTENQKAFQLCCEAAGVPYELVRSIDQAMAVLARWGVLREMRRAA